MNMTTTANTTANTTIPTDFASWQIAVSNETGTVEIAPRGDGYVRFSATKAGEKSPAWVTLRRIYSAADLQDIVLNAADFTKEARDILVINPGKSRGLYLATKGDRIKKSAWDKWVGMAALEAAIEELIRDNS